MSPIEQGLCG